MRDHEVVEYSDAGEAISHLLDGPPYPQYDVIVCDILMPGFSGMEVYDMVGERRPDMARKIVFTTGASVMSGIDSFLGSVQNPSVDKPFRIDHMRSVILEVGKS